MTVRRLGRWATIVLLVVGFVLLGSGGALADHWTVEVSAPEEGALGETIQLTATVHDAATGEPVESAELVFFSSVAFAGVGGDIELGEALTNDLGVAVFDYELRKLGTHTITIEGGDEPNILSFPVTIGGQLYQSPEGINLIPGAGGWVVTLVIGSIWVIMIIVGVAVIRVSRGSPPADNEAEAEEDQQERSTGTKWLNTATMVTAVMVIVAGGIVALLIRSPNTHHNRDPVGYDRSAVAFVEGAYAYPDFGLADDAAAEAEIGRGLFVTFGCAGCHGVDAEGTTTAKSPASASYDWVRQVIRNGQPGMPSYSEQELSDTQLNEIFAFLAEARGELGG
ncbi:MAG: c-type cytochrome [Acidimicrobiia bacterium]|nr:c-type cytochrome [Acidimicrobiia bacterium]MDH3396906.1 c-type cytochrome [Acidimicrobiia bacterium]